jgi:AcrR family transcriptional regulator
METRQDICKRGRPREFDPDAALDAALVVFWRSGYESASLSDLTDAMGINRPSLYAAFGNKQELFRRAIARYSARRDAAWNTAMQAPTARQAVESLLRGAADALTASCNPAGCFLVVSSLTCGPASRAVRDEVARHRAASAPLLQARFERAIADGDLPKKTNAAQLAAFFSTVSQRCIASSTSPCKPGRNDRLTNPRLRAKPNPPALAPLIGRSRSSQSPGIAASPPPMSRGSSTGLPRAGTPATPAAVGSPAR